MASWEGAWWLEKTGRQRRCKTSWGHGHGPPDSGGSSGTELNVILSDSNADLFLPPNGVCQGWVKSLELFQEAPSKGPSFALKPLAV